jgi:hypothetical protein
MYPRTLPRPVRTGFCAFLVLLAAAECPPRKDPCERPDQHTIVFVDQSASSVADSATTAMFRDTLKALIDTKLQSCGDAIHGFLVHGNTRGKVDRVDVVNRVPVDTADMSSIDKAKAISRHRQALAALREEGEARLTALLTANVPPHLKRQTDLLGTLEVVSDVMRQADSGSVARVYYLGDMHESMAPPRRSFDAQLPADADEARAWADADTALLRGMSIDRKHLEHVEVRVLLGSLAHKPGTAEVRSYWERLLANAGIEPVDYN